MYTISYLQTEDSSPKQLYCDDDMLFETLSLMDKIVHSYKVFKLGMKLSPDTFGWGNMPKWIQRFHYQEFEDEFTGRLS